MKAIFIALPAMAILYGVAIAGTTTATLLVEAMVEPYCQVAITNVSFGSSDGTTVRYANGSVSVTCQSGIPYSIALNGGADPILSGPLRTLRRSGTSTYLGYELYKDSGYTAIWGDGSTYPAGTAVSGISPGTATTHTVYGKLNIFAPNVTIGGYSDIVNVTVTY